MGQLTIIPLLEKKIYVYIYIYIYRQISKEISLTMYGFIDEPAYEILKRVNYFSSAIRKKNIVSYRIRLIFYQGIK